MLKRYWILGAILGLALCGGSVHATPADDALAAKVLVVFKEKCFSCHSPEAKVDQDVEAKKGMKKLPCIHDLAQLRANSKWVVPGNPDKTLIYTQVQKDDMPPEDSDVKPLSDPQKQTIKQWVLAGAPAGSQAAVVTTAPTASAPARTPRSFMARLIEFIGRFHPLAAHTPIAVLMGAAIAEMLYLRHPAPALTGASRFCMVLGALGAIATAALGWAMATAPSISKTPDLETHRWAGTIAAAACIPIAILGEWGARRAHREGRKWHGFSRWAFRIAVFAIAGFVGFTAHLGGLLVWPDLFKFPS